MKSVLISIATVVAGVLVAPAPAQATVPCPVNLPDANVVVSQADGDILVGSSTLVDCFVVLNSNVTVYTEGLGDPTYQSDYVFADAVAVSGLTIHGDVLSDGVTPILANPDLPQPGPSGFAPYGNLYVVLSHTTDTTVYGSSDQDYVGDGDSPFPNTNLVVYGNDGPDWLDEQTGVNTQFWGGDGGDLVELNTATGTIILNGGDGTDTLYDQYAASNPMAATRSTSSAVIKGGRGNDKLKALRHSDVVRAGKGRDVCRIVKGVQTHGCEQIVHV